jgi:hypothetical protein
MGSAYDPAAATLVVLDAPRPLDASEASILRLLAAQVGAAGLTAQVESAQVVQECSCGCRSVGLATPAPPVALDAVAAWAIPGRDDWCPVTARAIAADGRTVEVTLHLVEGRIHELEVWPSSLGGDPAVALSALSPLVPDP